MNKCVKCGCDDEEVLIKHHIDGNRLNTNPNNLMILCSNCHMKIHKRNFNHGCNHKPINLKSEIFNNLRLEEELLKLKERDKKVDKYLINKFKLFNKSN